MAQTIKQYKVGIFSPYLDTVSGGERYMMSLAESASRLGAKVDVYWKQKSIKKNLVRTLGLNLDNVEFITGAKNIFFSKGNLIDKWRVTSIYDYFFFLSDGSLPLLFASNNILLFQNPFPEFRLTLKNKIKLKLYKYIICNSKFTSKYIDQELGIKSKVIYPPVDTNSFFPSEKENIILSVGRYTPIKKQDVLIRVFKDLHDTKLKKWRLILIGNAFSPNDEYILKLKNLSLNYPIDIVISPTFDFIKNIYSKSKIYWHATGFGGNVDLHPQLTEHFGISTVEAMASGCVPVVINAGGQPEIVKNGYNGFLWNTLKELKRKTLTLATNPEKLKNTSKIAINSSTKFNKLKFLGQIEKIMTKRF